MSLSFGLSRSRSAFHCVGEQGLVGRSSQSAFQNTKLPVDVDDSGDATPLDALIIINSLNLHGSQVLTLEKGEGEKSDRIYVDVNGDGVISSIDALLVINELNRPERASGEGEEAHRTDAFGSSIDTQLAADIIAEDIAGFKRRKFLGVSKS